MSVATAGPARCQLPGRPVRRPGQGFHAANAAASSPLSPPVSASRPARSPLQPVQLPPARYLGSSPITFTIAPAGGGGGGLPPGLAIDRHTGVVAGSLFRAPPDWRPAGPPQEAAGGD